MKEYVAGFLFVESFLSNLSVVLIKKNKPAWQKSFLNGVGGKIEEGETPSQAMFREFEEETGLRVHDWREFCVLTAKDASWRVHFFSSFIKRKTLRMSFPILQQKTAEFVCWYDSDEIDRLHTINNLTWLVPMAKAKSPVIAEVKEV